MKIQSISSLTQTKAEQIHELMAHHHVFGCHQGAVLLVMGGEVIYAGGFGLADATWGIPNEPDVQYDFGSVMKPVFTMVGSRGYPW